jgi:adenylate kinase
MQASALDRVMEGRGPLVVLDVVVPEDVIIKRMAVRRICGQCGTNADVDGTDGCQKCGGALVTRTDDGVEIVRERLKVYLREGKPLVDYYSVRATFRAIDGNQPADVVASAVEAALKAAASAGGVVL